VHDLGGRLLTPGLVDPHNHAVYYGDALSDFELLTQGGTRADMIASGGGVGGLVRQTRAASDEQIYAASAARVAKLIAGGMTTLESKSGAGLDLETELRCLRIGRELGRKMPVRIVTTFLGAHGIAPEYRGRPDDYIDHLCKVVLPAAVAQGLGRPGGRLLRSHRVLSCPDHASLRDGAHARPARQAARRAVSRLPRGRPGRPVQGALRGPPRVRRRGNYPRHGRSRHRRDLAARRALDDGRDAAPARRALSPLRGQDGARHQLQSGQLAHLLADHDDEHGLPHVSG
jgi:hypothetical protein